jgi:hypothetical protein
MAAAQRSRKRLYIGIVAALLVLAAVAGFARIKGAGAVVDAAQKGCGGSGPGV